MRKLLLNSTALATVAALTASVAVADVTSGSDLAISASTEYKYTSRSSQVTATDGTTGVSDSAITLAFSNKTDSGLTVGYKVVMETEGGVMDADETSLTIEGGFGKLEIGEFDGAADTFGIAAVDLTAEEQTHSVASANINTNSDVVNTDSDGSKVAYYLPAIGGLTFGASYADEGAATGADTTDFGFAYAMEAGGTSVTIGGATTTTPSTTAKDITSNNIGVKLVSGDLKVTLSRGTYNAADEDRKATGVGASYLLGNGITLGAYMVSSDDDLDVGESYSASGVEAQYTIAPGLTAVVNLNSYEYEVGTDADSGQSQVSDNGSSTSLTIKASF